MSFRVMDLVLKASEPTGPRRWVLFLLAYRYNDDQGKAWQRIRGKDGMAEQLGYSDPAIVRGHLRTLEKDGWISTAHRSGRCSIYHINLPQLQAHARHSGGEGCMPPPSSAAGQTPPRGGVSAPPGGGIHPSRTEQNLKEPKGTYLPYKSPPWAAPGVLCTTAWEHRGVTSPVVVQLIQGEDGRFRFEHPRVPGQMLLARDFWPRLRPLEAAPQPQEATP